jgi:hypothetical protein
LLSISIAVLASCRAAAPPGDEVPPDEAAQIPVVENSGKRLSGVFVWKVEKDDYGEAGNPTDVELTLDEAGGFRRERRSAGGASAAEEGGYIIGTRNELVLYVEKVGGELLEAARVERYEILEEAGTRLRLQADRAGSFILQKKG